MKRWIVEKLGGEATAWLVLVLGLVIALDTADKGAVGAMATKLEQHFEISRADLGMLATASSGVAAFATIFFGWLVDRRRRTTVLAVAITLWGVAMAASAAALSYKYLLYSRVALGALTAAAVPAVASLVGDYFPPARRGQIYGYILAGEVIGAAFGLFVAGELAVISWRAGFAGLAVPAFLIAWLVRRLPEPPRDGRGRIRQGQERIDDWASKDSFDQNESGEESAQLLRKKTRERDIQPREELISSRDPREQSLWWAIRYVLRIPTNLILITASGLAYYFFSGIRVFGLEYLTGYFHVTHSEALGLFAIVGIGALCGVMTGGKLGDWLLKRGVLTARVLVVCGGYFVAGLLFIPTFLLSQLWIIVGTLTLAAFAFLSLFPPLDAARLDIMHAHLWGRAEAIRMAFRKAGEAVAPLLFGYVAGMFGDGAGALQKTFLIMLIPLFAGGIIGLFAIRTYPRDAATADEFVRRTQGREDENR